MASIFSDYTTQIVSAGATLLGVSAGVLGCFIVLKKESLVGDAISHAALPGICLAFLLLGTKDLSLFLLGALAAGLLSMLIVRTVVKYSKIKFDSALAIVLSAFFGLGLVFLTYIQRIPNSNQAGMEKFIFGQASTMLRREVYQLLAVGIILLILIVLFWKELKLYVFNPEYADSLGFSTKRISLLLVLMTVLAVVAGLQTVGVILMSAMLISPAVGARQWTDRLSVMVVLAGFFGGVSGLLGTLVSSSIRNMPTGPSVVLVLSAFVLLSLIFAPNRGLLWRQIRHVQNIKSIGRDKVLMNLYYLSLQHQMPHAHSLDAIGLGREKGKEKHFRRVLDKLVEDGFAVKEKPDYYRITDKGREHLAENGLIEGVKHGLL